MRLQTERWKDVYQNDWADSIIFKKCLKAEKQKRGIESHSIIMSSDGETSNDSYKTEVVHPQSPATTSRPPIIAENAQDPDTDMAIATERNQEPFLKTALA
jgi:hypothetical protein